MSGELTKTVWNHGATDLTVYTSGGNPVEIAAGFYRDFPVKFAAEVLACAKQQGLPFHAEPPSQVVVGSVVCAPVKVEAKPGLVMCGLVKAEVQSQFLVPLGLFDRRNLERLDRAILLSIADVVGCVPLLDEASKKEILDEISQQTGLFVEPVSGTNGPPPVTGATQPVTEEKGNQ